MGYTSFLQTMPEKEQTIRNGLIARDPFTEDEQKKRAADKSVCVFTAVFPKLLNFCIAVAFKLLFPDENVAPGINWLKLLFITTTLGRIESEFLLN